LSPLNAIDDVWYRTLGETEIRGAWPKFWSEMHWWANVVSLGALLWEGHRTPGTRSSQEWRRRGAYQWWTLADR